MEKRTKVPAQQNVYDPALGMSSGGGEQLSSSRVRRDPYSHEEPEQDQGKGKYGACRPD